MLRGERVTLRALRQEDLVRQWEFNNDLEIEILGGGAPPEPQSLERLQAQFQRDLGDRPRDGANFAIEADGKYIGGCGLFNFDWARTCELGIGIGDRQYWGGYGSEALALLLDYAFRVRNMRKVWLTVNANNERAMGAYKRSGFVEEGRFREHVWSDGKYVDLVQMGILQADWQKREG